MYHSFCIICCLVTKAKDYQASVFCYGNFQSCLWWPWHLFKIDNMSSACYWLKVQTFLLNNHCKSVFRFPRNVWRYYNANQKPLFIEQNIQWPNKKKHKQKNNGYIKLKTNDWATLSHLIIRVSSVVPEVLAVPVPIIAHLSLFLCRIAWYICRWILSNTYSNQIYLFPRITYPWVPLTPSFLYVVYKSNTSKRKANGQSQDIQRWHTNTYNISK